MALFIVGGSNSIFRDGWVAKLPGARNLSVGANTTLCGIFRCLLDDGPKSGDTIIWEYGLNEIVHSRMLYTTETILRNLEHFLILARRKRFKVLPLMLVPRKEELSDVMPGYYFDALDLFKQYGLTVVDASYEFRRRLGSVPSSYYADPVHYRRDDDVCGEIGRAVEKFLPEARIPLSAQPKLANGNIDLVRLRWSTIFENSIMKIPLTEMPVRIRMDGYGVARSIVAICRNGDSSGIRIRLTRRSTVLADARVSITCRNDKTILKAVNLDNVGNWSFCEGDILSMRYINAGGVVYAEQGLIARLRSVITPAEDALAGIIVERHE